MQKKELKQMENLLLHKKNALLKEVEERFKKYRDANIGKLTDIAEIASSVLNGDLEMYVAEVDVKELKQIEGALIRIKEGHYGVCEQCGRSIKKARLKAIPFATLCVSCKEEEEKECFENVPSQTRYEWEDNFVIGEIETDEIYKRQMGNKMIEFEYDDNKN
ncbi:MAG: TraR/DksA family transcriptional regulator [Candidatus Loosdrechtia sp.]|uniref:TraR/DksA family transcriptional regulator n=1 Tax=Candidatus Loosdrechtia sp. TaxID=3101272 RepID=UPI003A641AA3|nr:MAG: TraR/DksA family transcriptional regulator [Candidatus Jettenia sp. AMX2]